jgi:uncharacterized protein YhbP (UPF0306 family)
MTPARIDDARVDQLRAEIETFLSAHHTVALATVAAEGGAHVASLLYALEGLALIWTSDPASRHSRHIERDHRAAAVVAPEYDDFRAIRGVQIHGVARRLTTARDCDVARALLCARYPFLAAAEQPPALAPAWRGAAFYRLDPTRITLIDNTQGFGHKSTLELHGGRAGSPGTPGGSRGARSNPL